MSNDLRQTLELIKRDVLRNARLAADYAGAEAINWLRSETGAMQPPAKRGEQERAAHPGLWADVTGNLAGSYFYEVRDTFNGLAIDWTNPREYAKEVEGRKRKRGGKYWVLSELLTHDDSPVIDDYESAFNERMSR